MKTRIIKILALAVFMLAFTACSSTTSIDGLKFQLDDETGTYIVSSYTENTEVTEVTIPDDIEGIPVTGIGVSAFAYTNSLEVLNLGPNITDIDDWGITFNLY